MVGPQTFLDPPPLYSKDPMPGEKSVISNDCTFPSAPPESILSDQEDEDTSTYESSQPQASTNVLFDVSSLVNKGLDHFVAELLENLMGPANCRQKLYQLCGAENKKRNVVSVTVSWIWKFCIATSMMTLNVENEARFFRNISGGDDNIDIYMAMHAKKRDKIFPFWGRFTNIDIMYHQNQMKFSKPFLDECIGFCVLSKQTDASEKMQPISEQEFSFDQKMIAASKKYVAMHNQKADVRSTICHQEQKLSLIPVFEILYQNKKQKKTKTAHVVGCNYKVQPQANKQAFSLSQKVMS